MPTIYEVRATDTLSLDPAAIAQDRADLREQVEGSSEFTLRDEAAGEVQHVLKAVHMAGQNHALQAGQDPIAQMLGLSSANDMDLDQINARLGFVGAEISDISELTPWAVAYLIVDLVTLIFAELTEDLPTL